MPKNATILLIRHAEKPGDPEIDRLEDGTFLTPAGRERALAYIAFFQTHLITDVHGKGDDLFAPDALFAARDSKASHRPRLTLEPVAVNTGLDLNCDYEDSDLKGIVKALEEPPAQKILVCWHHGTIINLANALLAPHGGPLPTLPPANRWPDTWPGKVFGWVMQIRYDGAGKPMVDWTKCSNQGMMVNDTTNPPGNAA
jgi:broad specificity phosphatase PhoE